MSRNAGEKETAACGAAAVIQFRAAGRSSTKSANARSGASPAYVTNASNDFSVRTTAGNAGMRHMAFIPVMQKSPRQQGR